MPVTLEEVRAALAPEELDYQKAAKELGVEALPHLERLIAAAQPLLASKAAYLAGVIGSPASVPAIERAARSGDARVRIAAASAVQHLSAAAASDVLLTLVDDADVGVQKTALRSVPTAASAVLRSRVEGLSRTASSAAVVRSLSREIMARDAASETASAAGTEASVGPARRGSSKGGPRAAGKAAAKKGVAKKGAAKKGAAKKGGSKKGAAKKSTAKKSSRRSTGKKR